MLEHYYNGVWTIPTLNNGASAFLTITGIASSSMAGTTITNTATRTAEDQYNSLSPTTSANVYTKIANLSITNTANNSNLNVGDTGTFTVNVVNNGLDTANNIQINDPLPAGFSYSTTAGSYNPTTGIWTITSLTNGQTATLTFTKIMTASDAGTTTTNKATATWTEYPSTTTIPNSTIHVNNAVLAITNTGTTPVSVGNTGTFKIIITNNGPDTATNIRIKDLIPTGFVASTTTGNYDGTTWTINSLAYGSTATLTFTKTMTTADAGTTTTNHATATWTEYPSTVVIPNSSIHVIAAAISITNAGTTPVNVGQTATYTVTATNNGPDTANNIQITDPTPTGYTANTPSIGTYTNGIWTITSLTNGQTATLTFTKIMTTADAGTSTTNHATATWTEYPSTITIPDSTINVNKMASIAITNTGTTPVNVGNTATYTITATNNGPQTANNIQINDPTPTGYTANTPSIGTYTNGIWTITSLTNGQTATLTFTKLMTTADAGTSTTNHATATWTEYPSTVTIPDSTINVNKMASIAITNTGTTPVNVGSTATYTVTATNNGPQTANNIQITDPTPTGYTANTPSIGTYTNGIWTITSLTNGQTATLTFTKLMTTADAGTSTTNHATATWTEYPSTVTIPDSTINVNKMASIAITNTGTTPVNVGSTATYTVTATNNGPQTANNIQITDPTPTGYTANTPSIGTYTNGIWTITSLTNGQTATLTFTKLMTTADAGTSTTNHATATWTEYPSTVTIPDSTINVNKMASIAITNTGTTPVNVGSTATYTVTATNNGPQTANNIQITDPTPTGYTANTPSIGTYTNGIWTITSLTNGQTATLTFTKLMTTADAGTSTTNHATATWTEYPSTVTIPDSTINVNKMASIAITNTGTTPVNVGSTATYTVTATNNGPQTANNIQITDPTPTGYTANTPSIGTYTNGIWTITSLTNGQTATLTFTKLMTTADAGTSTTNHATATWTEYPSTVTIPDSTINVNKADVGLSEVGSFNGNTVTFIVTATNNGPNTGTNIVINDAIPAGLSNVVVTPSTGTSYSNGVWTISSLADLATATLNITGTSIPKSTTINNATRISQTEYNSLSNSTTASVYTPLINIEVDNYPWFYDSVTGYQTEYSLGNSPVFSMDVYNDYDEVTGVKLSYTYGNGFSLISYDTMGIGTVTQTGNTLTWTINRMPAGGAAFMNIVLRVIQSGNYTPNLTTTAQLIGLDPGYVDSDPTDNEMNCSISAPSSADIQVNQTVTGIPKTNQQITYTITTTNNGPDTANNIQITDKIPTGLGNITITPSIGTYNKTTGIWTIPTLTNGQTATLTITATITATNGTIINTATKKSQNGQYDWNYNNNAQTTQLTLTGNYTPNISIDVENDPWAYDSVTGYQTEYSVGNSPVFSMDVYNNNAEVTGVKLSYTYGNGFSLISYDTMGIGTVTQTGNTLTWTINRMPAGGIAFMNIVLRVIQSGNYTPNLTTTAQLIGLDPGYIDNNPTDFNQMNCSISAPSSADIQVNQTVTGIPKTNQQITYTITTTNNGPDTANNIQINDKIPTGLGNITITPSIGTYNKTTGIWTIPTLTNGQTATLTITATITATNGTIINTATKKSQNGQNDWNYNNNAQTTYLDIYD